ncbi:hypothetical protein BaRGS_00040011 [Batillaria attramentaria]|uniref:Uncharacterized protein n=1 Tax=Batillaria attramentaria TaxID=370345 RepID=A0ABD0J249_9CAEN
MRRRPIYNNKVTPRESALYPTAKIMMWTRGGSFDNAHGVPFSSNHFVPVIEKDDFDDDWAFQEPDISEPSLLVTAILVNKAFNLTDGNVLPVSTNCPPELSTLSSAFSLLPTTQSPASSTGPSSNHARRSKRRASSESLDEMDLETFISEHTVAVDSDSDDEGEEPSITWKRVKRPICKDKFQPATPPGPRHHLPADALPSEYFFLYFKEELLDKMVESANAYVPIYLAEQRRKKEVDVRVQQVTGIRSSCPSLIKT